MQNVDRLFILTGLLFLLVGMGLGLHMGAAQDYTLDQLHAHVNLLGFVVMMLFGLAYHAWPAMKESVLATIHYFLHAIATLVAMCMLYFVLSDPESGPTLGPIMDLVFAGTTVGVLIFGFLFFTRAKG